MDRQRVVMFILLVFGVLTSDAHQLQFREGDVVFLVSPSPHTDPILLATKSQIGHVGMVLKHNGALMIFEAVSPVKYTPIDVWTKKQEGKHFMVRRLTDAKSILTPSNLLRLDSAASVMEGRPYDSWYNWSDEKLYCSELVWKIFDRVLDVKLCNLRKMRDYDLSSPEVQKRLKERFPGGAPLDEMVVSPQDIYESNQLVTVYQQ